MTDLTVVETAHAGWRNFDSFPESELKAALGRLSEQPTPGATAFFASVVANFDPDDTDGFWIQQAIGYAGTLGRASPDAVHYLEAILGDYRRYSVLSGLIGTAAYALGRIADHPNTLLVRAIEGDSVGFYAPPAAEDDDAELVAFVRAAAYGAYIMTPTDFQTGFDAAQELKGSRRRPTVELAEQVIGSWRAHQGKS